jgi:glutamine synthetase adenylyltransferase
LRKLEHRMRIVHDRSEHTLPRDPVELDKLARRVGHTSGAALRADYEHWTREVRLAYERILAA